MWQHSVPTPHTLIFLLVLWLTAALLPSATEQARAWGKPKEAESGWRTDWRGRYPDAEPPLTWSAEENVTWKLRTSQWSNASPVLHKNRLFICEEPSTLVCVDQRKGEVLWKASVPFEKFVEAPSGKSDSDRARLKQLGAERVKLSKEARTLNQQLRTSPQEAVVRTKLKETQGRLNAVSAELKSLRDRMKASGKPPTHATNGYSSPTPVAAGDRVYVFFGYGAAAAFDLDGRQIWANMVERSRNGWGHSASPLLTDGKLILHINSTVHALDPESGEELWTAPSGSTWGTPLPLMIGGERAVLTTGASLIRCRDGKVVAQGIGRMPWTSPVESGGVIYMADQNGAFAYRLPERLEDATAVEKLWQTSPPRDRYYASPIVHEGLLYAINQRGHFSVLDTADGIVLYSKKLNLRGTMYPSITLAGGNLYVSDDQGTTLVLEPGREYRELAANRLEPFRSTPVFDGKRLYIRGLQHLYCIGEE